MQLPALLTEETELPHQSVIAIRWISRYHPRFNGSLGSFGLFHAL